MTTTSNGYATFDDLKGACSGRREADVVLPVCGLKVRIRSLSEREKSEFEAEAVNANGNQIRSKVKNIRRRLIVRCSVEPQLKAEHIVELGNMDGKDLAAWGNACSELVGFSDADIEKLEGNFEPSTDAS